MLFKKITNIFSNINENLCKSLSKNNKKDIFSETKKVEIIDKNINIPKIKQLKK